MIFVNLWGYNPYSRNSQCKGPVVRALVECLKDHLEVSGISQVKLVVKNPSANVGYVRDSDSVPGLGRYPGERHGNPLQYSYLENPMTEEPGGLQPMGSQRVGHDSATNNMYRQSLLNIHQGKKK